MSGFARFCKQCFLFIYKFVAGLLSFSVIIVLSILSAIFTIGLFILGWQVYGYFRYGSWVSYSMIDVFKYLNIDWAHYPADWIGFYNMFDSIPASIGLMVIGLIFSGIAHAFAESSDRRFRSVRNQ